MNLVELYNAIAPCIGPVLMEKYPQVAGAAGELVIISAAVSRLMAAAKGDGKVGTMAGWLGKAVNFLGMFRPAAK